MTTYMTLHVHRKGDWVYVPDALTPKWGQYPSYKACIGWKNKLGDVINNETILVQCVSQEVKDKFDHPPLKGKTVTVVEQPDPVVPEGLSQTQIGISIALAIAVTIAAYFVIRKRWK